MKDLLKKRRKYGYDIVINNLEPILRNYISKNILIPQYGDKWRSHIPDSIIQDIKGIKGELELDNLSISEFFEELSFLHLKVILSKKKHFTKSTPLIGNLSNVKFQEIMDELNKYRRKIAHAKSTFSTLDLDNMIAYITLLCQGEAQEAKHIKKYLQNKEYYNADEIPENFSIEYDCLNNLPYEDYVLDGGFVGRTEEKKSIIKLIESQQDRIVSVTGAGGVGKTALALRIAYSFIESSNNPFISILWFSAKTDILKDGGIEPIEPDISNDTQLINDILEILDPETFNKFKTENSDIALYKDQIYSIFSTERILLIIDNLETLFQIENLLDLIKNVPRPTQVLITSRRGLGELERRYSLVDMQTRDAVVLFRIIAKEKRLMDLVKLPTSTIEELVKRVRCYPLLIKWSLGQICLGKDINDAFNKIFSGESEIAQFSFNDVFAVLTEQSQLILFSMIVYGNLPITKRAIMYLTGLNEDEFEDSIRELILVSFVYMTHSQKEEKITTEFSMLTLTRGFIESKYNESDEKVKSVLRTQYYDLGKIVEDFEKSKTLYYQSRYEIGAKSIDEQVAFNFVKVAKNYANQGLYTKAESHFDDALQTAPHFAYPYSEYAKYALDRGNYSFAKQLAKRAVDVDTENFHAWLSYGKVLRRTHNIHDGIKCLEKAKKLNPNFPPIDNEIGRSYTFLGEYNKAEDKFLEILSKKDLPNIHHRIVALCFRADNLRRWAQTQSKNGEYNEAKKIIEKSYVLILEAVELKKSDKITRYYFRNICTEYGIILLKSSDYENSEKYFLKSIETFEDQNKIYYPRYNDLARTYYFLACLHKNRDGINDINVLNYVEKGLAVCPPTYRYYEKLKNLKEEIAKSLTKVSRKKGKIKFYDTNKRFGVIIVKKDESYVFFLKDFRQRIFAEEILDLRGKKVSFIPTENPKGLKAIDIVLKT